jgi:hypothetical protein
MKQPSYREAVEWIALNDDESETRVAVIEGLTTVALVADLFGRSQRTVARAVRNYRKGAP